MVLVRVDVPAAAVAALHEAGLDAWLGDDGAVRASVAGRPASDVARVLAGTGRLPA